MTVPPGTAPVGAGVVDGASEAFTGAVSRAASPSSSISMTESSSLSAGNFSADVEPGSPIHFWQNSLVSGAPHKTPQDPSLQGRLWEQELLDGSLVFTAVAVRDQFALAGALQVPPISPPSGLHSRSLHPLPLFRSCPGLPGPRSGRCRRDPPLPVWSPPLPSCLEPSPGSPSNSPFPVLPHGLRIKLLAILLLVILVFVA